MRFMHSPFSSLILYAALALPFSLQNTAAYADEFKTQSTLKAATVFTDRATLTRTTELTIPAGKHVVVLENLPATLFQDSLRVQGTGTAQATLGALSSKIVNSIELVSAREQELNTEKEKLENQRKVIDAEKQALQAKLTFLNSLKAQASTKTSEEEIANFDLNTAQWESAANTIYTGIADTLKTSLQKDVEIQTIDKKISKINQDLNQLRTGQKRTYEVRLPIEAKKSGKITLELNYQLPNVNWHPVYDARLDTENEALELTQYGAVNQRTGEDWDNIELTLSTAQPQRGATIPHMPPMWVSLYQNNRAAGHSARQKAVSNMLAARESEFAADSIAEIAAAPLAVQTATINTSGFSAEYSIPGLSSIPADGTETKVLIAPFNVDTKLEIHIKPQLTNNAYLIAKSTLKGETPILPGLVSLFRDGGYIGQTQIPLLRPGEEQELSFGIDDQISVDHKTLKDEQGEEGILIGKNKTIERETITAIQNLHQQDMTIVTLQNIPASRNEDITIKILQDKTTSGYETDYSNQKGLTRWHFVLKPKEKKDIQLGYSVSWPKDETLTGLH